MSFAWSPLLRSATVLLMLKNSKMSADLFSFSSFSPLRDIAILRMVLRYSILCRLDVYRCWQFSSRSSSIAARFFSCISR